MVGVAQVDTPGVFSSREALMGKSGCRWGSWLGVCPHLLPAIHFLPHTQLPGTPVVTRHVPQKGSITGPYPLPAWKEKKGWSVIPWSKGTEGQHKVLSSTLLIFICFHFLFLFGNQKCVGKCNLPPFSKRRAHQRLLDWSGGCVKGLSLIIGCVPRLASICW